ncbi:tautomerase family protein [Bacillus sp. 03113]|uniref:tautomerase family protein n=1 Tax=Bacillus sp. 03113 TaxID=2578211 RepID=UPI00114230F4|nr:tautomerase family protein [Bacillus sp. 03113]
MPFVRVSYKEEQYNEKKLHLISKNILDALIEEFDVPKKDYFQVFHSHKKEEFYFDKNYLLDKNRTEQLLYIQITCGSGRTREQKQSLYKKLNDKLFLNCKVAKENIFIVLLETELEDWSFGQGYAQMIL